MHSASSYWPDSPSSSLSSSTLVDFVPPSSPDNLVTLLELPTLVSGKISTQTIRYLVDRVYDAVDFGLNRPSSSVSSPTSKRNSTKPSKADSERAAFIDFVATVIRRADVTLSAVIGALVYIDRARPHLSIAIEEWALHRVFLGSLIVASKYLNDASLKNAHWALCTGVFGRRDIQRIEREFLDVLAWELAVSEADLVRICSKMVEEGVLARPHVKKVELVSPVREVRMEVDSQSVAAKPRKSLTHGSMRMVRALWDEKARRQQVNPHRPEKRAQADVTDMDVDDFEERARRRRSAYPSPASSDGSSAYTASSSPATDSDDGNSPCTPPPPHQAPVSLGQYGVPTKSLPHPMRAKSASSGSMTYQPLTLLDAFPHPPVPTPALALSPVQAPTAPPPLPSLPPYPSFLLHRAFPASHLHLRPHSTRPASPYAKPSLSAGPGSLARSMTPYTHRRSVALSSIPMAAVPASLYPAYIPATNA